LVRQTVAAMLTLRHRGERGRDVFPSEIEVLIRAAPGNLEVIRNFVADIAFDHDVEAALANRLVQSTPEELPTRRYVVVEATAPGTEPFVMARPSTTPTEYELHVTVGDCQGHTAPIPIGMRLMVFGRREKVTTFDELPIDLPIPTQNASVSRRAGRLHRAGGRFEIEALDQRRNLLLRRPGEVRERLPFNSSTKRLPLEPEVDEIVLTDERGRDALVLKLRRSTAADVGDHARS
jgi:hypothetical protein